MKCSLGISNFLEEISSLSILLFSSFSFIDHWERLSYVTLIFFGTLHSDVHWFPSLLCLLPLFFSQVFVRPCQTTILPFCISFSWGFILSTGAEAEAPILWLPEVKSSLIRKDWYWERLRQEEKGMTEDVMLGWLSQLKGHKFGESLGGSEGQGSLACCSP